MPDDSLDSASVGGAGSSGDSGSSTAIAEAPASSPAGESTPPSPASLPGPVPYDRFKDINDRYGAVRWAETLNPQTVAQQQAFFEWLDRDPAGAFRYMEDYLGRAGVLRKAEADAGRPTPSIRIPETGQQFYTAEDADKLVAWALSQTQAQLEQRLQPIEQAHVQNVARAAAAHQIAEAEQWPHYKEHEGEILQAMERDHRLSLEGAYTRVVVPRLRQLERQAIVKEMQAKPGASTHNPGAGTVSQPLPATKLSWADAFRREFNKRRG